MIPVYQPWLGPLEEEYVLDCVRSGWVSSVGKYVTRFEEEFAAFCGTRRAIAVSNGTVALHVALVALGIGPGDEVIAPSLTFIATANAIRHAGATPVLVDSEPATWNLDPKLFEAAVTPRTRGVIAVHLYGHPADMEAIRRITEEHGLFVIEDAAEAHGALYHGRPVGGLGTIGCFSFYGNKIITTGEGGMCVTDEDALADRIASLRDHGMSPDRRYWHPAVGYNYRLTNLQAALGVAQLSRVDEIIERKQRIAAWYEEGLKGVPGIGFAPHADDCRNVYWMYSVLIGPKFPRTRDEVIEGLAARDIDTRPFFVPVHLQPPYFSGLSLPVAEDLSSRGINLPSAPSLSRDQVELVCESIRSLDTGMTGPAR